MAGGVRAINQCPLLLAFPFLFLPVSPLLEVKICVNHLIPESPQNPLALSPRPAAAADVSTFPLSLSSF